MTECYGRRLAGMADMKNFYGVNQFHTKSPHRHWTECDYVEKHDSSLYCHRLFS